MNQEDFSDLKNIFPREIKNKSFQNIQDEDFFDVMHRKKSTSNSNKRPLNLNNYKNKTQQTIISQKPVITRATLTKFYTGYAGVIKKNSFDPIDNNENKSIRDLEIDKFLFGENRNIKFNNVKKKTKTPKNNRINLSLDLINKHNKNFEEKCFMNKETKILYTTNKIEKKYFTTEIYPTQENPRTNVRIMEENITSDKINNENIPSNNNKFTKETENKNNLFEKRYEQVVNENLELKRKNQILTRDIKALHKRINSQNQEVQNYKNIIMENELKIQNMQNINDPKLISQKDNSDLILNLQNVITHMKKSLNENKTNISELQSELKIKDEIINENENTINDYQAQLDEYNSKLTQSYIETKKLTQLNEQLTLEINKLKKFISEKETMISTLNNSIKLLTENLDKKKQEISNETNNFNITIQEKNEKITALEKEIVILKNEYETLSKNFTELNSINLSKNLFQSSNEINNNDKNKNYNTDRMPYKIFNFFGENRDDNNDNCDNLYSISNTLPNNIFTENQEFNNSYFNKTLANYNKQSNLVFSEKAIQNYPNIYTLIGPKIICFNLKYKKFISITPKDKTSGIFNHNITLTLNNNIFPLIINCLKGFFIIINKFIFFYEPKKNILYLLAQSIGNHSNGKAILINNELFILSGNLTNICEKYSLLKNNFLKLSSVNYKRINSGICNVNNEYIYLIFGKLSENTIEKYKISENNWELIKLKNLDKFRILNIEKFSTFLDDYNNIIIFGGKNEDKENQEIYGFNINENYLKLIGDTNLNALYLYNITFIDDDNMAIYDLSNGLHILNKDLDEHEIFKFKL